MIKTWVNSQGKQEFADEHSKAYRNRDEAKPAQGAAVQEAKPAPAKPTAVKPEGK